MLWCGSKGALESGEKSEKQLRLTTGAASNEGAEAGKVRGVHKIAQFCMKDRQDLEFSLTYLISDMKGLRVNNWCFC